MEQKKLKKIISSPSAKKEALGEDPASPSARWCGTRGSDSPPAPPPAQYLPAGPLPRRTLPPLPSHPPNRPCLPSLPTRRRLSLLLPPRARLLPRRARLLPHLLPLPLQLAPFLSVRCRSPPARATASTRPSCPGRRPRGGGAGCPSLSGRLRCDDRGSLSSVLPHAWSTLSGPRLHDLDAAPGSAPPDPPPAPASAPWTPPPDPPAAPGSAPWTPSPAPHRRIRRRRGFVSLHAGAAAPRICRPPRRSCGAAVRAPPR
jgi:hypothetical protein